MLVDIVKEHVLTTLITITLILHWQTQMWLCICIGKHKRR